MAGSRIHPSPLLSSLSLSRTRTFYRMQETLTVRSSGRLSVRLSVLLPTVLSSRTVGFQFGFQPMRQSYVLVSSFKYKLLFRLDGIICWANCVPVRVQPNTFTALEPCSTVFLVSIIDILVESRKNKRINLAKEIEHFIVINCNKSRRIRKKFINYDGIYQLRFNVDGGRSGNLFAFW